MTSIQFHGAEDSVLLLGCEDHSVTLWDLSVEEEAEKTSVNGKEVPSQLLFDHRGIKEPKEATFDKNVKDLVVVTGLSGFNVFQPDDVGGD